jgi:DNA polymerase-3 subunit alpha
LEIVDGNIKTINAESKNQNFNHLKIHSQYSICEGAIKIDDLKDFSKENKIKSLGLCDTSNLCGALEFAEKISKVGTQPIIGTQINFKLKIQLVYYLYLL